MRRSSACVLAGISIALLAPAPSTADVDCRRNCRAGERKDDSGCRVIQAGRPAAEATGRAQPSVLFTVEEQTWISPKGSWVASSPAHIAGPDGARTVVADARTGKTTFTVEGSSPEWSPDESRLLTSVADKQDDDRHRVRLWDGKTGALVASLDGVDAKDGGDGAASFDASSARLVTLGDHAVHVWDAATGKLLHTLATPMEKAQPQSRPTAHFVGARLVTISKPAFPAFKLWDLTKGTVLVDTLGSFEFSASRDNTLVAAAAAHDKLGVYATATGKLLHKLAVEPSDFQLSGDGKRLVASDGNKSRVWDTRTGALIHVIPHSESSRISPDGSLLVSASDAQTIRVIDTVTAKTLYTLRGSLSRLRFSKDGTALVFHEVPEVRDARTGAVKYRLVGSQTYFLDDTGVVVGLTRQPAESRIYERATGKLIATIPGQVSWVSADRSRARSVDTIDAKRVDRMWRIGR